MSGFTQVCRKDMAFHRRKNFLIVRRLERRDDFSDETRDIVAGIEEFERVAKAATSLSPGSSPPSPLDFRRRRLSLVWLLEFSLRTN